MGWDANFGQAARAKDKVDVGAVSLMKTVSEMPGNPDVRPQADAIRPGRDRFRLKTSRLKIQAGKFPRNAAIRNNAR